MCLKLGLVGMGEVQCEIVLHFSSRGKCPALFCVLGDGNYQSVKTCLISLRENEHK